MELNQINKLFDKTNEDLIVCEQKIQNWTKFINDYKDLEQRLSTLTDRTTHEIMVPLGGSDLAFMEGYIHHTNEILVLLGDNYFVELSAKQAVDIVGRRITKCNDMLEQLNKEKSQLQNWLSASKQFSDEQQSQEFVEIVEQYDEKTEQMWKEKHKQKVKEYKLSEKSKIQFSDDLKINEKLNKLEIKDNTSKELQLKSILKRKSSPQNENIAIDESRHSLLPVRADEESKLSSKCDKHVVNKPIDDQKVEIAFKNEIKERDIDQELGVPETNVCVKSSPKIVSRFKANRMKK